MGLFFAILIFFNSTSFASPLSEFAQSAQWKGLLQYKTSFLGIERSEVDGPEFFLSPEGATHPDDELVQTIKVMQLPTQPDQKGEDNQHAICRFPARARAIEAGLGIEFSAKPNCAGLQTYLDRVKDTKVSIVFTSYYAGNASSVFGHSFLKFSGDNANELFDTGVNFAANPTTSNPILYSLYGLIGVFPASFSAQPFYYKVREYNDSESRDLWAYELNLQPNEKSQLLLHLWELAHTYYSYFYLNENCSYQIMRAIEGAIPRIQFFSRRPMYLIPSESIQILKKVPGLVGEIHYRPSLRNVTLNGYNHLSLLKQNEVKQALERRQAPELDSQVQDVVIDAIDLNADHSSGTNENDRAQFKDQVLRQRALTEASAVVPPVPVPEDERPDRGHGIGRIRFGNFIESSSSRSENILHFQVRGSHHDLLDPSVGYPRYLHIDFGRLGFKYRPRSKEFMLEDFTVVDLTALSLVHPLLNQWSYAVKIGYSRAWFRDCLQNQFDCGKYSARVGFGKAYPWLGKHAIYALMNLEPSFGPSYQGGKLKIRVGPSVNFLFEWEKYFKTQLSLESNYYFESQHAFYEEGRLQSRYIFQDQFGLDLDLANGFQGSEHYTRMGLSALLYF